jgi:hypothetical protein
MVGIRRTDAASRGRMLKGWHPKNGCGIRRADALRLASEERMRHPEGGCLRVGIRHPKGGCLRADSRQGVKGSHHTRAWEPGQLVGIFFLYSIYLRFHCRCDYLPFQWQSQLWRRKHLEKGIVADKSPLFDAEGWKRMHANDFGTLSASSRRPIEYQHDRFERCIFLDQGYQSLLLLPQL